MPRTNLTVIDEATGEARVAKMQAPGTPFSALMVLELAMRQDSPQAICEAYSVSRERFVVLVKDPIFRKAFDEACDMLKRDGMSFKSKAKIQAEELLGVSWNMINNVHVPSAVRADLLKATVRWAEYEPKQGAGPGGSGSNFQININL